MITAAHIACKIGGMSPVLVPGVQQYNPVDESDKLDGTTAEDGGFKNPDFGLAGLSLDLTLVIDVLAGNLVTISRGTEITDLKIYAHIDADPIYTIPLFRVFRSNPKGEINGKFTYDVHGESVGSYTLSNPSDVT